MNILPFGARPLQFAHGAGSPSPLSFLLPLPLQGPSGGEGRGEGVSPRVADSRFVEAPPHPDLLPRRSGLPDLRIIDAEVGQARLRVGGEGVQASCSPHRRTMMNN